MQKIMQNAVPANAKVAKQAVEDMEKCVLEFITFFTSEGVLSLLLLSLSLSLYPLPIILLLPHQPPVPYPQTDTPQSNPFQPQQPSPKLRAVFWMVTIY